MMAAYSERLIDGFSGIKGVIALSADIRKYSWFRVGGPADLLFRPADVTDIRAFVRQINQLNPDLGVFPLGVGSNVLIRDGGVDAAVIHLGKAFNAIAIDGTQITAGAGALDVAVSDAAQKAGLAGLEFLRGIPGMIGGAVAMNAGAYGSDISACLAHADVVLPSGALTRLSNEDFAFAYRRSGVPKGAIVVAATFDAAFDDKAAIAARVDKIVQSREESQPLRSRTGGSTFKNPDPEISHGRSAWQLIDQAGLRGATLGGAQVSEKHCNFLINTGAATAADIEGLGEHVRAVVRDKFDVRLEWEIKRVGRPGRADGGLNA